jgi:uncharacterized protein YjbI with pentapeptide repeats
MMSSSDAATTVQIHNPTPLALGWLVAKVTPPTHTLTLVVKGTFVLAPGAAASPAAEPDREPLQGDASWDDDRAASCRYASDYAPFKPRADVLLVGTCHTPDGKVLPVCRVALSAGSLRKELAVVGDRRWVPSAVLGLQPSEPVPFRSMPLRYENSFGGKGYGANPTGKGWVKEADAAGEARALPNIEALDRLLRAPRDAPGPAGFGPLDGRWAQRIARMGTYDDRWLKERWPWFPDDFDWGTFNAAPEDQQIAGYLRGDEPLLFENLHPEHPRFASRLPGVRPRCFLRADPEPGPALREVPLQLDTLWVDMDACKLVLVWRGVTPVQSLGYEEVRDILLVEEDLAQPPLPAEHHVGEHLPRAPEPAVEAANEERAARAESALPPDEAPAVDPELVQALADMRVMLEKARVAPALLEKLGAVTAADDFLAVLLSQLDHDPAAAERVEKEARERTRKLLVDRGYDPSILDEDEGATKGPERLGRLTREEVQARAARGEGCPDADLAGVDLSGLDLRGLDLSGADLTGARLAGVDLSGANLTRACLRRADLRGATLAQVVADQADLGGAELEKANLSGANLGAAGLTGAGLVEARLDGADLTGAFLAGADLRNASLAGAQLEKADLTHALLAGARGARAQLGEATLTSADLRGADLDGADLHGCAMDGANLERASLKGAFLHGARGAKVLAADTDLTALRCGEGASFPGGDFRRIKGDGSIWSGADLAGADFGAATLVRAIFDDAVLQGSNFHRAVLKQASLMKANLRSARLTKVDLFQGTLDRADLTEADLRGSNLYGCGFLEATLARIKLGGANLKGTEIAARGLAT